MRRDFDEIVYTSRLWTVVLGLPLACGSAEDDLSAPNAASGADFGESLDSTGSSTGILKAAPLAFPGAGTSGAAQPLLASLAPDTSSACDPQPTVSAVPSTAQVQTVCFYDPASPDVPAALIEQVVEVVGTSEWVHMRLTLNPDFVDNTFGDTAIGWGEASDEPAPTPPDGTAPPDASAPPPAPEDDATPPAVERPQRREPRDRAARPNKGGHTFKDLVGSDHAEVQLLDAEGNVSVHFKLDYISESSTAASGFASLGVSGGEGQLIVGEPEWFLATATSFDRNLNACGLSSFTESSPITDELYTPDPSATHWDFRVAYEVWVSTEAFGAVGFGSALIENVHASPSKLESNTVDVSPAPCPIDPGNPETTPEPLPIVLQNIR